MADHSDIFNRVRSAVDIVEVIGEHIALKRAGREFKGLCPFHEDHRPSMAVVPHKQIFHCFVCGTGGDVFKFVKEFHKMSAGEALRMLAQRAGIKLPELPPRGGAMAGRGNERDKGGLSPRERIANTNEWACSFFEKQLRTPQGKAGLDYLHGRGLTDETIAAFRLGFAPEGWTNLVNAALRTGISNENLLEAGLIKTRSDGSPYDAFRNRVIFPIIDATGGGGAGGGRGGRVIAFGGRVLEEKRDEAGNVVEAKYLNSPDTRLFNKSESLYGLNHARQQIIRTRTAVVVEGYMDVIACHQAGVTHVIATLGTALTPDHARILKNYAQAIVLVFDSDDAGRRASDRAMEVFVRSPLDVKITAVPDGKDPCDFCMKNGGEPFGRLVDKAIDAMSHKWQQLQSQFHTTESLTARQEGVTQFLRFVAAAFEGDASDAAPAPAIDPIRRGLLLAKVGALVNMPSADVQTLLRQLARQAARRPDAPRDEGAPPSPVATVRRINIDALRGLSAAEGWLLGTLLVQPVLYEKLRDQLSLNLFESLRPLATAMLEYLDNSGELSECTLADLTSALEDGELVRQAIEIEARTAEWHEPARLSPNHAKLLQHLSADRGLTLESLARQSLGELQTARGQTDPQVEADFAPPSPQPAPTPQIGTDADVLREIEQIKRRNAAGGNRRIVG